MKTDIEGRFSVQNVCGVLVNSGVITQQQAQNVLSLYEGTKKKLEKNEDDNDRFMPEEVDGLLIK